MNEHIILGAYHECAHVLMGYLCGYKVDEVVLDEMNSGNSVTKFNYGDSTLAIMGIIQPNDFPEEHEKLKTINKEDVLLIGRRYVQVLLAGSYGEAYYQKYIKGDTGNEHDISETDLKYIELVEEGLRLFEIEIGGDFTQKEYNNVVQVFVTNEPMGKALMYLSDKLVAAPGYTLSNREIEMHLKDCGYFDFLDSVKN